jgi:hypothetical protein
MPIFTAASAGTEHGAIVPIASTRLTSQYSPITFVNVPQTYQDLMLVVVSRINGTQMQTIAVNMYLNTLVQSASGWSSTRMLSDGLAVSSIRTLQSGPTYGAYASTPGGFSIPNSAGSLVFHILNYTSSSTYKTVLVKGAYELNGYGGTELNVGTFASNSPVTTVQIGSGYGMPYFEGSTFTLYGVRSVGQ